MNSRCSVFFYRFASSTLVDDEVDNGAKHQRVWVSWENFLSDAAFYAWDGIPAYGDRMMVPILAVPDDRWLLLLLLGKSHRTNGNTNKGTLRPDSVRKLSHRTTTDSFKITICCLFRSCIRRWSWLLVTYQSLIFSSPFLLRWALASVPGACCGNQNAITSTQLSATSKPAKRTTSIAPVLRRKSVRFGVFFSFFCCTGYYSTAPGIKEITE